MVMRIIFSHYGNENLEITVLKCHENNVTIQKKKRKLLVTFFWFCSEMWGSWLYAKHAAERYHFPFKRRLIFILFFYEGPLNWSWNCRRNDMNREYIRKDFQIPIFTTKTRLCWSREHSKHPQRHYLTKTRSSDLLLNAIWGSWSRSLLHFFSLYFQGIQ